MNKKLKRKVSSIAKYHLHEAHPEKTQFEVYDLKEYLQKNGPKASIPHSHSYYQIIWFLEEGGTHLVDFKTYPVLKNTILFVGKDQVHAFDGSLSKGWLLHFNESFFLHTDMDAMLKHNMFKSNENPSYTAEKELLVLATKYRDLLLEELAHSHQFGFEESIRYLLKGLLITLERAHRKATSKKLTFTNQQELQLFRFKELLENNYREHLSVVSYADKLHISSKTLTALTKKQVNKSPSQLISERVLLEAKRLLRYTPLQINEVAYKLGFKDASYFVKYFKRYEAVSPSAFRESILKS